ncbi:transglycosylase SLT domain-containing protein [Noviherbaspirillum aridicola]|uniref:Transglycosylase SLT domain-containing protein n=1 Tax=Noviherbaspirillum aridicola TaxID=2849687 RepID=A0ABQ4Q4G2_9BURK|nr:transglycosylase SLT domain-containing protein [Noviherbaspirillum aridicola]GIZ52073.1 hypothetical protein NCCP691_20870 [Noviherbaspirillum aridicola]
MSCRVGSSGGTEHTYHSHGGGKPQTGNSPGATTDEWDIDGGSRDGGGAVSGSGTPDGSGFNAGPNGGLTPWKKGIDDAAYISGIDPNLIGGQVWAESRGRPNTVTTNIDGTSDVGLMQISQERWLNDIVPNLTPEQRQRIKERTGKDATELNMNDPEENLIGGALELQNWIRQKGSVEEALRFYVSGGVPGVGSPTYVSDVLNFQSILSRGGSLPP